MHLSDLMYDALLTLCMVFGEIPREPPPNPQQITFPVLNPTPPAPTPQPLPQPTPSPFDQPVKLPSDVFYVVTSNDPFLGVSSPSNGLTITRETGPIKIRGRFIENPTKVETREFTAKHVMCVEAGARMGTHELLVWPTGATEEKQVTRRQFTIGQMPIPPPPGPNPPGPNPPDPIDPTKELRVVWAVETKTTTPTENNLISAGEIRDFLNEKCVKENGQPAWRKYDKDQDVSKDGDEWKEIWESIRTSKGFKEKLPMIVVFNGTEGKFYELSPKDDKGVRKTLSKDAVLTILKKHTGG